MNEQEKRREREIADRARQLFTESVRRLDGETRSRLARARAKAVDAAESNRMTWPGFTPRLVPLGGIAAAALAVLLIWQNSDTPVGPEAPIVLGDLDILLEGENLDLFEELEFYVWLLEQPELLEVDETADGSG